MEFSERAIIANYVRAIITIFCCCNNTFYSNNTDVYLLKTKDLYM